MTISRKDNQYKELRYNHAKKSNHEEEHLGDPFALDQACVD